MLSVAREVSALADRNWRNLLILNELLVKLQFPSPFLGLKNLADNVCSRQCLYDNWAVQETISPEPGGGLPDPD